MIIYNRERKRLVIPNGIGNADSRSGDYSAGYSEGYERGQSVQEAIDNSKLTASVTFTENGTYSASYGYKKVLVNVDTPTPLLQEKSVSIDNSTATINPDEGYDGMSKVTVDASAVFDDGVANGKSTALANVSDNAIELNVSSNGVYNTSISSEGDGYIKKVTVQVPSISSDLVETFFRTIDNADWDYSGIFLQELATVGEDLNIRSGAFSHIGAIHIELPTNCKSIGSGAFLLHHYGSTLKIYSFATAAPTLPSFGGGAFTEVGSGEVEVHYPSSADYSSWMTVYPNWTFINDL